MSCSVAGHLKTFPAALFLGLHISIHLRYLLDFYFDFCTPQRLSRTTAAATGFTALLFSGYLSCR
ncbi:hypothetical protein EV421DRAFT_1761885 [Armillaria borealis]|uniref:Uncharacterized protein n=1 Tax=Armillaria borealis TaxID=47425 RepID=A0AA39MZX2_9AGAR|nr:hypothetical protein EV421DRAFT_1761885 [Armillaria borealis]